MRLAPVGNHLLLLQIPISFSHSFRPVAGCFEGFARFEQTLETGKDQRPAARNRLDELRVGFIHLVEDGELDRLSLWFEFIGQARIAFGVQLRFEFVALSQNEPFVRLDFDNLAAIGDAPVRHHDPPGSARFPFGFVTGCAPIAASEFGVD
jgi:hypothetical protein